LAEAFGILSGAVGIAATFTVCVDCFEYIQLGRHFGRDFQTSILIFDSARLRLTRWGQAVNIYTDPKLGNPEAKQEEISNAKATLFQILVLFSDTEKISKRYRLNAELSGDPSVYSINDMDLETIALHNKMKQLALKRQKRTGILKIASWTLYHGSEFKRLIENITMLIDNLEDIFPSRARQNELVQQEVEQVQSRQEQELLRNATKDVDGLLHRVTDKVLTGHLFLNVTVRNQGRALNGDTVGNGWEGPLIGRGNVYDGVIIEDNARVHNGNQYGGKSFWDD
ncbi:hypothetical protein M422DRAFT_170682, partial [Sphaerobolus stellatus SS14]